MTETTPVNINLAFSKFQAEIQSMELSKEVSVRTKTGGTYSFKYAPLSQIIEKIRPVMAKHNLSFVQTIVDGQMVTVILHSGGDSLKSGIPFLAPQNCTAQELGSWITYVRRYGLTTALGLVSEEDDDGNHATGNTIETPKMNAPMKKFIATSSGTSTSKGCECGGTYSVKEGKYGKFLSCSNYPTCTIRAPKLPKESLEIEPPPSFDEEY